MLGRHGLIFLVLGVFVGSIQAQQRPRIIRPVDENSVQRLQNTRHPLAVPASDRGRVAATLPFDRMQLHLNSSPEQQAALDQLLVDQQNPASPDYHNWLTPQQFGERFGAAQQDLDAITAWLGSHGFHSISVAPGRRSIEFSGTAGQVEAAFHTEMHQYVVDGETHVANATEIAIPSALSPVVGGVVSLHDFRHRALHHDVKRVPDTNLASGGHGISPYDFAAIYNVTSLWSAGFDGTGQSVAVAARTNINPADVIKFRAAYGLPGNNTQIVLNGPDPGIVSSSEEMEADLDVQWAGGVAKGATAMLVVSGSTGASDGVDLSTSYIVNNNLASAMSVSFGECEWYMGTANNFYNSLWSQAASQGISIFVSAGDSGSAGCDTPSSTRPATLGFGVSGLASTPYNVAVGGTQFNDTASPSTYWNTSNDGNGASVKGYIPEVVWNESGYTTPRASSNSLWAGSGGLSSIYTRPSWQTGNGVPTGQYRAMPDVSLTAAGHDGYLVYREGSLYQVGGTSASSPAMAGVMTILNQHSGGRNGNPNLKFYALAASQPSIYHDVTTGTNAVPCSGGSPNCTTAKPASNVGVMTGYSAGPGYDMATGWGSMDANAMASAWGASLPPVLSITGLTPNPMTASATAQTLTIHGSAFQSGATVKVGAASLAATFVSSTQLTVSVTEAAGGSFPVTVTNPGGAVSNSVNLTVNASTTSLAITSLSPNPMTASATAQTLTIKGTGFQSGATVKVGTASPAVTFVSSTQLTVPVTEAAAGTFAVTVTNPGGAVSNSVNLTVNAATTTLAITSLSPNPMTASATAQTLTIKGTGFQSGATVKVGTASPAVTFVSSTQLTVSVTEAAAGTFPVTVTNPGGAASNSVNLTVNAPGAAAVITSISPASVTGSNAILLFTVNGTGFQPGLTLEIGSLNISAAQLNSLTSTQLSVWISTGTAAGTYPVKVVNPGAASSNTVNFQVVASATRTPR